MSLICWVNPVSDLAECFSGNVSAKPPTYLWAFSAKYWSDINTFPSFALSTCPSTTPSIKISDLADFSAKPCGKLTQSPARLSARWSINSPPTVYSLCKRRNVPLPRLPDPANSCAQVDHEIELERNECIGCLSLTISRSLTKFGVDWMHEREDILT